MDKNIMTVIIPSHDENQDQLAQTICNLSDDPSVSEIIVVDDCSSVPLAIKGVRIVRNASRIGPAASRSVGLSVVRSPIAMTVDAHVGFKTRGWGQIMVNAVLANPKGVACPVCLPRGYNTFRGKIYGGELDVIISRNGMPIILEPRWNTTPKNVTGCSMGGAYAFMTDWHRKIGSYEGIKGWCPTEMVAVSLKARMSGGLCVVANAEMEHEFRQSPPYTVIPPKTSYNKMRLAFVALPQEISNPLLGLLMAMPGGKEAMNEWTADFKDIAGERESFRAACGGDPMEAVRKTGINLDLILNMMDEKT